MIWMLPLIIWSKFNKKNITKRAILNVLGAILVLVLTIVALLYIRKINIKNRIVTNYDKSWHVECADENDMATCLPIYDK